jgi:hypothetical protein
MLLRPAILFALSLPLLACTAEAVSDARAQVTLVKPGRQPGFAYALVTRDGGMVVGTGHSDDWKAVHRGKGVPADEFLWFKQDGKDYVLTDPALVARARAAMQPMRELGERMGELGGRMGEYGAQMGRHGAAMAERGKRMEERARAALAAGEAPEPPEPPALDEDAERRMEAVGERMRELGEEMEALGKRQEAAAAVAETAVLAIAREALAAGAAQPMPR